MMVHAFNPGAEDAEAGGDLCVQGQLGLCREFHDSGG